MTGFHDIVAGALATARTVAGVSVTYKRGNALVLLDNVAIGKTLFPRDAVEGLVEQIEYRDYLIGAADLVLNGQPIEPEPDDEIIESQGEKVATYRVTRIPGEKAFRPSDPGRTQLRVHTLQVDVT